jgi:hypothetical protein
MPTDRYTKILLTIIAAALVGIVAQNAIKGSYAQSDEIRKVAICDLRAIPAACANVATITPGVQGVVTQSR